MKQKLHVLCKQKLQELQYTDLLKNDWIGNLPYTFEDWCLPFRYDYYWKHLVESISVKK